MVRLSVQAIAGYAFEFTGGYPLWPLLGLGGCFWLYLLAQPRDSRLNIQYRAESLDSSLFLLLALACSAFVLDRRGEPILTLPYFWHLSVLTLFQMLIPFIIATCLRRAQLFTTAITALLLMFFLYKGSEQKAGPVLDYLESANAYQRVNPTPDPLETARANAAVAAEKEKRWASKREAAKYHASTGARNREKAAGSL